MSNYDSFTEPPDGAPEDSKACPECGETAAGCHCTEDDHFNCCRFHCSECKRCDPYWDWHREQSQSGRHWFWAALSRCCEAELVHGNGKEVLPEEIE